MTIDQLWKVAKDLQSELNHFPTVDELCEKTKIQKKTLSKVYDRWISSGVIEKHQDKLDTLSANNKELTRELTEANKKIVKLEKSKNDLSSNYTFVKDNYENILGEKEKIQEKNKVLESELEGMNAMMNMLQTDYNIMKADKELPRKDENQKLKINGMFVFKSFCFLIGILLLSCSVHFTYRFNCEAMTTPWAFVLSLAIVCFTSFAFSIAMFTSRKTRLIIYLMWSVGVAYSIFTALASQMEDFRKYIANDITSISNKKNLIYENQLQDLLKREQELLPSVKLETEYNNDPDLKNNHYGNWIRIKQNIEELKQVRKEIKSIQLNIFNNVEEQKVIEKNKTIYQWLSEVIGIRASFIQFLTLLFPSIFIDFVTGIVFKFSLEGVKDERES